MNGIWREGVRKLNIGCRRHSSGYSGAANEINAVYSTKHYLINWYHQQVKIFSYVVNYNIL